MLTLLRIEGFRGLRDVSFEPLSRINVLTGFNNSGKTTVLEALYLLFADGNQFQNYPSIFRSSQTDQAERYEHFWRWLLPGGDFQKGEAELHVITDDKRKLGIIVKRNQQNAKMLSVQYLDSSRSSVTWGVSEGGFGQLQTRNWPRMQVFSPRMSDPISDAEQFNKLQLISGGEERLLGLMRVVEPKLQKLRYAKITKQPLVYADVGLTSLIPTSQLGHAFGRMLTLYMEMLVSKAEVLLIDEIENGLHHSVYEEVWKGIATLAWGENIQVFVTSHSEECVNAAAKAAKRGDDHGFSRHRLEDFKGEMIVNTSQEIFGGTIPPKVDEIMRRSKSAEAIKDDQGK
jgi:AAA15 family ATPase/GTPase